MAKRIIFAVAGAGKTTYILNQLNLSENSLIITYTLNNLENLRAGIMDRFGFFPSNISLQSYFSFLHSFCYQPFLQDIYNTRGLNFLPNPYRYAKGHDRFIDRSRRLYSNRLARFLFENDAQDLINDRIIKYFENLYIDEVQDFAGHDFTLLMNILETEINTLLVGDFYQHTFDTSRDGNVNASLHDDYNDYIDKFRHAGIHVDTSTLRKSYRCSPTVCKFISENIGIEIESDREDETLVLEITENNEAERIFNNPRIVKLFYKEHYKYNCFSQNWGDSKGVDKYSNVCVVLNKTTNSRFQTHTISELPPQTKNKLYVACSRAWNNLFFVPEEIIIANRIN